MTATVHKTSRTISNPLIQDEVTLIESSAESGGMHTLVEVKLAPKGGNGLHYHTSFSETFEVLEGILGIGAGKQNKCLQPGESFTVAPREVHRFFNPSAKEAIRFTVKLTPGSPGFEHTLQATYGLCRDGKANKTGLPRNLYHTALILTWSDTNIPGIFSWFVPVLRWLARKAEQKGIGNSLRKQYCHW